MKNSIYVLGIMTAYLMMAGTLCKVMHWPGANIILVLGSALFSFVFLPIALLNSYREMKQYGLLHWVTFIVFGSGMLSILFKVMHWPGSNMLLQLCFPLPFVLFLPVYLYQTRHEKKVNDTQFQAILFGLTFIAVFSVLLSLYTG